VFHKLDATGCSVLSSGKRLIVVGLLVTSTSLQGIGLCLLLAATGLTACKPNDASGPGAMEQKVEAMMGKIGVPGASATPSKTAMALDCPPIKTMLDEVRTAPDAISPASRRALNAWARWCNQEALPE
jgi:hypothetical protein